MQVMTHDRGTESIVMTQIRKIRQLLIATTAILLLAVSSVSVHAQQTEPSGDEYASGDYGRVRYQINGLTIRRSGLTYEGAADINSPVFPGDSIVTGPDQRAEVELADGDVIHIDRNSEVTFLAMPSPYHATTHRTRTALRPRHTLLRFRLGALA